jgi:glutamate racemase
MPAHTRPPPSTTEDRMRPIGVFDSGVGGLSVLREIRRALPAEALHYVADSAHAPYGDKAPEFIEARAQRLVEFLLTLGVKAVVVACNTVTGLAIQHLRQRFPLLPIVAIEPAVKPAARATRTGVAAVLATRRTVASAGLARLIEAHGQGARMLLQACPGWVERVERGDLDSAETEAAVAAFVTPLLAQGADTLVLGCTHYPFLAPVIRRVAGPGVEVLDPAAAVARELARRLTADGLAAGDRTEAPAARFWTSADPTQAAPVIEALWGEAAIVAPLPPEFRHSPATDTGSVPVLTCGRWQPGCNRT